MSYFDYEGKQIYYEIIGEGKPLMLLHGNTSSSKLFSQLLPLYTDFQVILLDFLGYGQSTRLAEFPTELWKFEANQTIALLEYLKMKDVHIVGTSGGAWVALNVALLRPDLVATVTADSFDGRTLHEGFEESLVAERAAAAKNPQAAQFYQWVIGEDWQTVVKKDTDSMVRLIHSGKPLFVAALKTLQCPLLLTATLNDGMIRSTIKEEYQAIIEEVPQAECHLFENPGHPAIGTNAEGVAEAIKRFISENS